MSNSQDNNFNKNNDEQHSPNSNNSPRSQGSSPFASPRSDNTASSPRFEQFIRGMRIPTTSNSESSNASFLTAGSHFCF